MLIPKIGVEDSTPKLEASSFASRDTSSPQGQDFLTPSSQQLLPTLSPLAVFTGSQA